MTPASPGDGIPGCPAIGADISRKLTARLAGSRLCVPSGYFRPLGREEARELGYADGDPVILLRHEDGEVFEVSVEVRVKPVTDGAARYWLPEVPGD